MNKTKAPDRAFVAYTVERKASVEKYTGSIIDFCNGELVLQCTRPDWQQPETWGLGAAPQTMDARWVRLTVC